MRRYRVHIQPSAVAEIESAYRWMEENHTRAASAAWHARLRRAIEGLETFPLRHPEAAESVPWLRFRDLRVAPYRVLFVVEGDVVDIVHARHESRRPFDPGEPTYN